VIGNEPEKELWQLEQEMREAIGGCCGRGVLSENAVRSVFDRYLAKVKQLEYGPTTSELLTVYRERDEARAELARLAELGLDGIDREEKLKAEAAGEYRRGVAACSAWLRKTYPNGAADGTAQSVVHSEHKRHALADYMEVDCDGALATHVRAKQAEALEAAATELKQDDEATDEDYDHMDLPGIVDERGLIKARDAVLWLRERAASLRKENDQ
jgi:hypothetical protein